MYVVVHLLLDLFLKKFAAYWRNPATLNRMRNYVCLLLPSIQILKCFTVFISRGTDPKTLCPYCDTPLPPQPTPLLTRLLDQTFNKSYRDKRPANPLGRKAKMGVFVAVCQRHRFESETLPEAKAEGWPTCIDWSGVEDRVLKMKRDLSHILTDPGDPVVYRNNDEKETQNDGTEPQQSKGPRMRCIFWKDLLKDLKNNGTKGVKGVQGQFANFEKTQPG